MNSKTSLVSRISYLVHRPHLFLPQVGGGLGRETLHPSRFTALTFVLTLGLCLAVKFDLSHADMSGLAERVIEHQLSNGMKVLMVERHQTPVVSINLTFGVGGMNEHTGRTGVAHLYEHMAFKGTRTVGTKDYEKERPLLEELHRLGAEIERRQREAASAVKTSGRQSADGAPALDQLMQRFKELQDKASEYVVANEMALLYQRHGAVGLNAATGKDLTRYMVSLPSNRLPLWAALEADRMAHPVLREFYKERSVVMEERRLRTDDNPHGLLFEAFAAAAFQAHPYGLPTVGWASDLEALTPAATEEFFKTYYGPAGATVAIVGDIDPKEVIDLLQRTFGAIPPAPPPPRVVTVEPPQRGERRVEVEFDAEPTLLIGYHKPGIGHPDDFVFDVIDAVLSDGVTSRLYSRLVREKRLAVSVVTDTNYPGVRAPNLFVISATPLAPHTAAEVEAAIYEELERLKTEPVTPQELEKVLNNLDASLVRSLRSNGGLASQLAFYQTVAGDWRYVLDARDRIAKVTPEDIQRVVTQYLKKSNRTVATLVKMPAHRKVAAKAAGEVKP